MPVVILRRGLEGGGVEVTVVVVDEVGDGRGHVRSSEAAGSYNGLSGCRVIELSGPPPDNRTTRQPDNRPRATCEQTVSTRNPPLTACVLTARFPAPVKNSASRRARAET
jgi:hypothetical protein